MSLDSIFHREKRVRSDVPWSWIEGAIDKHLKSKLEPPRIITTVHCSDLNNICPRQWVLDFWFPRERESSYKKEMYVGLGNFLHETFQKILGDLGVLKGNWITPDGSLVENSYIPEKDSIFLEQRVFDPYYRLSGKMDGIIDAARLEKIHKAGEIIDTSDVPPDEHILEIKTTNAHNYSMSKSPATLPIGYRLQATAYQMLSGYEKTLFLIVNRDSFNAKTISYEAELELWDDIKKLCTDIWKAIKTKTLPEPKNKDDIEITQEEFLKWLEDVPPNPQRERLKMNEIVG